MTINDAGESVLGEHIQQSYRSLRSVASVTPIVAPSATSSLSVINIRLYANTSRATLNRNADVGNIRVGRVEWRVCLVVVRAVTFKDSTM